MRDTFERLGVESPLARLERSLIDEFLRAQGCDPLKLADLPETERDALLKHASVFASSRLAEVESRSHFLDDMHDGGPGRSKTNH